MRILALAGDGQYELSGSHLVEEAGKNAGERVVEHVSASLGRDGNLIRQEFEQIEKNIEGRHLPVEPLTHYSDGINASDPFVKYREFYRVLESYLGESKEINEWIDQKKPDIRREKDEDGFFIPVISWIRHKITHGKKGEKGLDPLLISNQQDVQLVQYYLPVVQDLARKIIREHENV